MLHETSAHKNSHHTDDLKTGGFEVSFKDTLERQEL